jgi:hypothetical protein
LSGQDAPVRAGVDAKFGVTSPEVLHERVAAHDHAGSVVAFGSARSKRASGVVVRCPSRRAGLHTSEDNWAHWHRVPSGRRRDADRIAASALAGWAEHSRSFFSVRAYSRRSGAVYALGHDNARVALEAVTLPDLLMYYLVYVMEGSEVAALSEVEHQLSALRVGRPPETSLG